MNGAIVFLIFVVGSMVVLGIVIVVADSLGGGGARRKELTKTKDQRDLAYGVIEEIEAACEEYKEIDHPLASRLAPLISGFKKEEWKLRK